MKNEGNRQVNPQVVRTSEDKKLSKLRELQRRIQIRERDLSSIKEVLVRNPGNKYLEVAADYGVRDLARMRIKAGKLEAKLGKWTCTMGAVTE